MGEDARRDDVDHRGPGAGAEVRQRLLDEEERAAHVGLVRLGKGLGRDVAQWLGQRVGGVVDHDVDATEGLDRASDQVAQLVESADVGRHRQGRSARGANRIDRLLARLGLSAGDDDVGSHGREAHGNRSPDAATPAGDHGDPVAQVEGVER